MTQADKTEWRTIETAPSTMSDQEPVTVLLYVANGGMNQKGIIRFGHVHKSQVDGKCRAQAEGYFGDWEITHWMPLPEPPKAAS